MSPVCIMSLWRKQNAGRGDNSESIMNHAMSTCFPLVSDCQVDP